MMMVKPERMRLPFFSLNIHHNSQRQDDWLALHSNFTSSQLHLTSELAFLLEVDITWTFASTLHPPPPPPFFHNADVFLVAAPCMMIPAELLNMIVSTASGLDIEEETALGVQSYVSLPIASSHFKSDFNFLAVSFRDLDEGYGALCSFANAIGCPMPLGLDKVTSPECFVNSCRLVCRSWDQSLSHGGIANRAVHIKQRYHDILLQEATKKVFSDGICNKITILTFILHEPDQVRIQNAVISIMSHSPNVRKLTLGMTPESYRSFHRGLYIRDPLIVGMEDALVKMTSLRSLFINLLLRPSSGETVLRAISANVKLRVLALKIEVIGFCSKGIPDYAVTMKNLKTLVVDMRGETGSRRGKHPLSIFNMHFPHLRTLVLALPLDDWRTTSQVLQSANTLILRSQVSHFLLANKNPLSEARLEHARLNTLQLPACITQVAIPQHFILQNSDGQQHFPGLRKLALLCDVALHPFQAENLIYEIEDHIKMCDRLTFPDLKSVQLMDLSMDKLVSLDFQSLVRCLLLAPQLKTINVRLSDDQGPHSTDLPDQIYMLYPSC